MFVSFLQNLKEKKRSRYAPCSPCSAMQYKQKKPASAHGTKRHGKFPYMDRSGEKPYYNFHYRVSLLKVNLLFRLVLFFSHFTHLFAGVLQKSQGMTHRWMLRSVRSFRRQQPIPQPQQPYRCGDHHGYHIRPR
ncbi:hypothetical protein SAMN04487909_101206 [Aneurinibacillus migulanus]|uniref:Uncharacterized protein n=1 Tax=Aneurinibacillus migulanus TaxID=47500 RepID=A0A1G8H1I7_ANEMI|nr:hypothetical protein SAMN04487909_101206 [Aneurinibacillus migulanus]